MNDEYLLWPWQFVATNTALFRGSAIIGEAWIVQLPDGWYALTDRTKVISGPYADESVARAISRAQIGLPSEE